LKLHKGGSCAHDYHGLQPIPIPSLVRQQRRDSLSLSILPKPYPVNGCKLIFH
jgi:hypothetical protein